MTTADVCLLLEGTYPFVRGGVSTWVHQIVSGLPERRFALVFVGGRRADYGELRYALPPNVVHLEAHYLEDAMRHAKPRRARMGESALREAATFHRYLQSGGPEPHGAAPMHRVLARLETPEGLRSEQLLYADGAWQLLREHYLESHEGTPFLDYFWTVRLMHGPIFQLARLAREVPAAKLYHTISTGFAGLLGAILHARRGRPLLLSEHGIYTKERKIDLHGAPWIDARGPAPHPADVDRTASIRALWIRYFESLGRLTYDASAKIISLYEGNRERQHRDGADPTRTRVIVNGVDVDRFAPALAARDETIPKTVGLIGRVVPIKDVKCFLRAMRVAVSRMPEVRGVIVGGAEEDPAYAAECERLLASLDLCGHVQFLGHQDVVEVFPRLGLLALSSISEAQPLAVLEAFASGVPCVTTEVGACREQIEGRTAEDRALGRAGRVVPFADSDALGQAFTELLGDRERWLRCQAAGLRRVRTYYTQRVMLDAYRDLYAGMEAA